MSSRPQAQEDVQSSLQGLRNKWEAVKRKMAEHGDQLRQARQQAQLLGLLQVGRREGRGTGGRLGLCWARLGGNRQEGRGGEESGCSAYSGVALFRGLWPVAS